jgi:phytoene synthase
MFVSRLSFVAREVRQFDRDRFVTALFAPADRREALLALYAFNLEIAQIREHASEPMLGRIRLQWWRDTVEAAFAGTNSIAHPVAQALAAVISAYQPSRWLFDRLFDSRMADLEEAPFADLAALETYAEGTAATVNALALEILGIDEDVCFRVGRHLGIAWALTGILRATPFQASAGRVVLPSAILARHQVSADDLLSGRGSPGLAGVGQDVAARAREHLARARHYAAEVPRAALPGMLTGPLTERYLDLLRGCGGDLMNARWSRAKPRPVLLAWNLWRGKY